MSLAEGTGGSSSPEAVALGEVLTFFGTVADYAAARAPEESERIASLATGMAKIAGLSQQETDALYFAARLRNAGAIGNLPFAKGGTLSEREAVAAAWDIPAHGARMCERIAALPPGTADMVRWQAECWDGTGYPDQLRWSGIPKSAQLLHIASVYAASTDPEEALSAITLQSGRSFAPEQAHAFTMWFHTFGGEVESVAPPYGALKPDLTPLPDVLDLISERVDAHNGTPGRAERIARSVEETAKQLGFDAHELRQARLASLLFGIGELRSGQLECERFDPLSRLGRETRSQHALIASKFAAQCPYLYDVAPVLRARAEWYDGTGGPDGLRQAAIPRAAHVLAACIAFDALDEAYPTRLESAAGTQFDPDVVRALGEAVKARV